MNVTPEKPTRLVAGGRVTGISNDAILAQAALLLRVLQAPPPRMSPSARARIAVQLAEAGAPPLPHHRRALWPAALAAAVVLFAGAAVGAAWGLEPARRLLAHWLLAGTEPVRAAPAPRPPVSPVSPVSIDIAPVPSEAPPVETAPPPASAHARRGRAVAAPARRPEVAVDSVAPAEDPIVAESRLLAEALASLRQHRAPARALRALDEYERLYPSGALAPEASAARIDALLALGRRDQALERLEALSIDRLPRAIELRVLRGELRAGRGQLVGAVSDFGAVLATAGASASVIERALYGRGSCRARLGDAAGARADLEEVTRRFPHGQFAGPAGRALRD